jgi:7-carboxy-7-deazaguanine synthase
MLPIIEMFASIQGEGKFSGKPSIFIRVSGCNLRCMFKDSICDTPYSSFNPEKSLYKSVDDEVQAFKEISKAHPRIKHVVITGGEPLLYKNDLEEFLGLIYTDDMVITIETNGTRPILNPISNKFKIDLYSVSPKLSTSVGKPNENISEEVISRHNSTRIDIPNLVDLVCYSRDYQFKFVYSGPECINEILDIYSKMAESIENNGEVTEMMYKKKHPMNHTMLMPEGITEDQLRTKREEIVEKCMEMGWTYTDRLQILIWGDKRGV